ncbi:MAG: sulfurtransferase TusA family protein [Gammaproteobacteria bacterium]|nr:sulfurtransferase TusA family protein [Gammaproteobacteria bacterium]
MSDKPKHEEVDMSSSKYKTHQLLDTSGLQCPLPVIHCKATLSKLESGQVLHLISTECDMQRLVASLIKCCGEKLLHTELINGRQHFYIQKQTDGKHVRRNKISPITKHGIFSAIKT